VAIEAGGTKFNLVAASSFEEALSNPLTAVTTSDPSDTWPVLREWLRGEHARNPISAVGVGSFGPLDLANERISPTTPKAAWRNFSWRDALGEALTGVPFALDTDTNAAAWAEYVTTIDGDIDTLAYLTVGTGIGGGLVANGAIVHGHRHPEFGHQRVSREVDDTFAGVCPTHGDCLEGLASGPAMAQRWGALAETLDREHPAWDLEARYLAQGIANIMYLTSPERLVVGGGVGLAAGLLARVRPHLDRVLSGYLDSDASSVVVPPQHHDRAGVLGAYLLGAGVGSRRDLGER
jgi:fructokinase